MGSLQRAILACCPAQPSPGQCGDSGSPRGWPEAVVAGIPTGARLLWKRALLGTGLWVTAGVDDRRNCHFCDLITENPVRITCVSFINSVPPRPLRLMTSLERSFH